MAQNFDKVKLWQIKVGKFLTSKKLMNANVFILSSSLLCMHAALYISIAMAVCSKKILIPWYARGLRMHCNWHKHKLDKPFWVAAGYVWTWWRACDITLLHMHWPCVPVWWNIHSLLTRRDGWDAPIGKL